MSKKTDQQGGFTLVELILAMALFSFVLLFITAGFLNVIKLYESGLAMRNTQANTRYGIDDIVAAGHSAYQVAVVGSGTAQQICLYEPANVVQYYIATGSGYSLNKLLLPAGSPCNTVASGGQVISSSDVVAVQLTGQVSGPTTYTPGSPQTLTLTLGVASRLNLLRTSSGVPQPACVPGEGGQQFCSVTLLNSTVSLQGAH